MQIQENVDLKPFNTFGISASAKYFIHTDDEKTIEEALLFTRDKGENLMILGGGSNVLFTRDFNGLIIHLQNKGIEATNEDDTVLVSANAGENWHQFVMYCIENQYCGIENLSLIPGCVGASPMQNIGAYGVEIKDFFHSLEAIHIKTGEIHTFYKDDCHFGYRDSVFKNKHKNEYIITKVKFRLKTTPDLNVSYGAIMQELEKMNVCRPGIKEVSQAVINIRKSKLPDPALIGNAGSFFKNPVVKKELAQQLKEKYHDFVSFPVDEAHEKLAAGWLIEKAGWKGFREKDYGVHAKQALVLVNYGRAKGHEILNLSQRIIDDILTRFGVLLEREVNIV
ncbi:MAG: UDP-N-acetylmuramate dehydrogenase [Flavobacteriales bacterium]